MDAWLSKWLARWTSPGRLLVTALVLITAVAIVLIGSTPDRPDRPDRERTQTASSEIARTVTYPSGLPASAVPHSTASSVASRCARSATATAARRVASRFIRAYLAYSSGRAGPRPALPMATGAFRLQVWEQSHSPSPAERSVRFTARILSLSTPGPATAIARVEIAERITDNVSNSRQGVPPFMLTVSLAATGCRWLAAGL